MSSPALLVRHVLAAEVARLHELRLASLAADPDAFGATYARDAAQPREWWERWAARSEEGTAERTFVLVDGEDRWLGLALVRRDDQRPAAAVLYAMWVAPEARGRRGGVALCDACAAWGSALGLEQLSLSVVVGNEPAERAYRAAGLVVSGQATWAQEDRTLDTLIMSRRL